MLKSQSIGLTKFILGLLLDNRFGVGAELFPKIQEEIKHIPESEILDYIYDQLVAVDSLLIKDGRKQFERIVRVCLENDRLLADYALVGKVVHINYYSAHEPFLLGNEVLMNVDSDGANTWVDYSATAVTSVTIPGNHFTVLQMPNAQSLATEINKALL